MYSFTSSYLQPTASRTPASKTRCTHFMGLKVLSGRRTTVRMERTYRQSCFLKLAGRPMENIAQRSTLIADSGEKDGRSFFKELRDEVERRRK